LTFLFLFGGIFIRAESIPIGWYWVYILNPVPKALAALALPQFACEDTDPLNPCSRISVFSNGVAVQIPRHEYVAQTLKSSYGNYWNETGVVVLIFCVYQIIGMLLLRFVKFIKR
jgi:hypothetical protein